ncbi:MAG: hypothetical protein ACAI38_04810 [Myxococcota bacterium]|nr:hypothetical protein [Myxococcota bacterium]
MTGISATATVADIQKDIAKQGAIFTGEDLEKQGKEAQKGAASRTQVNAALAKTNGRAAVERGGIGDEGIHTVASVGTGVGGGHPDGSSRSGTRARAHRIATPT